MAIETFKDHQFKENGKINQEFPDLTIAKVYSCN